MIQIDKEMIIKAIEHCKTCQCNGCPFKGRGSYCLAVLEYLIKNKREQDEITKVGEVEMITVQESMDYIHGICVTKELSDCQKEALDIAIKAVQKQIPKEPVNFHKNYDEHEWRKNADGEPDEWAWMFDIHNGPVCERCGFSFCEGCNPHGWTAKKCYIDYYSCPECRNQIEKGDKFCKKCGQALQWDKFKKLLNGVEHDRSRY